MSMSDWTPEALAEEERRLQAEIDKGQCPWSGYSIKRCKRIDLCDCFLPLEGGTVEGGLALQPERFTVVDPS